MTFLELDKQYQSYKQSLSDTLNELGRICSNFIEDNPEYFEDMEYVSNPYEMGYNEEYDMHWIDTKNNTITVNFSHQDPYDAICDSNSQIKYPLHWVEAVLEGSVSSIRSVTPEIKDSILGYNKVQIAHGKREAIHQALQYGLISEEQAAKFLGELKLG